MILLSSGLLSIVIPMTLFGVIFASFYVNIRMAKKRVVKWKRCSTFWFVGSIRMTYRAEFWMKELQYDEAEALILAEYQTQTIYFAILGGWIVVLIAIALSRA